MKKRKIFDKKFWLTTAFVVGATVLDIETTARCRPNTNCAEANPLWGKHPSRAKMYGIKGSFAVFAISSTWWWKRDDMRKMERWELRLDRNTPEPRIWEKPRQNWYVPALIVGGVTGAAGIYNLITADTKKTTLPAQPMKGSVNVSPIVGGLSGPLRTSDFAGRPSNTGPPEVLRLLGSGTQQ